MPISRLQETLWNITGDSTEAQIEDRASRQPNFELTAHCVPEIYDHQTGLIRWRTLNVSAFRVAGCCSVFGGFLFGQQP